MSKLTNSYTTARGLTPFEVWLSQLASDQPHLGLVENERNRVRFALIREALVAVLREAEGQALVSSPPGWFYQLLTLWHLKRSTLISFNYDAIVEAGVSSMCLEPAEIQAPSFSDFEAPVPYSAPAAKVLSPEVLFHGQPPLVVPGEGPTGTNMRLLKLHGSLGWWWVEGDESGATLAREPSMCRFGSPATSDEIARRASLPGRVPFIIPPLATKSAYFGNPVTRQLWQDAFEALREAETVAIIGYSLPGNDTMVGSMIGEALADSKCAITIVNPDADRVEQRLHALGIRSPIYNIDDEEECAERWARTACARTSVDVPAQLIPLLNVARTEAENAAVVRWSKEGRPIYARVMKIEYGEGRRAIVLTEEAMGGYSVDPGDGPTVRQVIHTLGDANEIWARYPDGRKAPIVGFEAPHFDNPHYHHVLYLIPAGQLEG